MDSCSVFQLTSAYSRQVKPLMTLMMSVQRYLSSIFGTLKKTQSPFHSRLIPSNSIYTHDVHTFYLLSPVSSAFGWVILQAALFCCSPWPSYSFRANPTTFPPHPSETLVFHILFLSVWDIPKSTLAPSFLTHQETENTSEICGFHSCK